MFAELLHEATTHLPTSILSAPGSVNFALCPFAPGAVVFAGVVAETLLLAGDSVVVSLLLVGVFVAVGLVVVVVGVMVGCRCASCGFARCLCVAQNRKYPPPRHLAVAGLVQPAALHCGAPPVFVLVELLFSFDGGMISIRSQ